MIDIHAHILPAIDDGPTDINLALEMAKIAVNEGTHKVVATPHLIPGEFDVTREMIIKAVASFNLVLKSKDIPLEVFPGAENYLDYDLVSRVKEGEALTLNNTGKYLLVELPMHSFPEYTEQVFFKLKLLGITPILAHPERNVEIIKNPMLISNLVQKGVLTQINSNSILGSFGQTVKKTAELFLRYNLVHFIASDCHSAGTRCPGLKQAAEEASKIIGNEKVQELVAENPLKVINGKDIEIGAFTEILVSKESFLTKLKTKLFS